MTVSRQTDSQGNSITLSSIPLNRSIVQQFQVYQLVFDSIHIRVFWKDVELRFAGCNRAFASDFNTTPENIIGKTDYDLTPATADLFRADDQAIIASGQPRLNYEEAQEHPDGEISWLRTSKIPLRNSSDDVIGVLGMYENITEQKRAAAESERLQQQIIEAQRQALQELSTPLIPLMEGILVMPLVGSIDTARARDIMRSMLKGIGDYRAKVVILDITGVSVVDSGVAAHLNKTVQAARLKGVQTIITGISDAVAETIVDLGIDWSRIETLRDLQSGLTRALDNLGWQIGKKNRGKPAG